MKTTPECAPSNPDRPSGKARQLTTASSKAQEGRQRLNTPLHQALNPGVVRLVELLAIQAAREAVLANVDAEATE
jgi:hypothetical protein